MVTSSVVGLVASSDPPMVTSLVLGLVASPKLPMIPAPVFGCSLVSSLSKSTASSMFCFT
uniref:Uncharacterized protein n=1 Tax=Arundo donax TaxID=35708 RepID=A0A0A9CQG8_ARUDO